MRPRDLISLRIVAGLLAAPIYSSAASPPTYMVTPITALVPTAINNYGDIAGNVGNQAALYRNGSLQLLGTLGGTASFATDLNDAGQVTGSSFTASGASHAFLYSGGSMIDLGTLGGDSSTGAGINASGQVIGTSATASGVSHAFVYSGTMMDLGALLFIAPGVPAGSSSGLSINNAGQVTGDYIKGGVHQPFYYEAGTPYDMGSVGLVVRTESAINNGGEVAGFSCRFDCLSFTFEGSTKTGLSLPRFGDETMAWSINDAGWIVGNGGRDIDPSQALLFIDRQPYNLNQYVDATGRGQVLNRAFDINEQGQILATGNYFTDYFLLSPVPEPETWTLMSLGLLLLARGTRRCKGRPCSA
jgi:probable HAF family extracellular repeat protein